MVEGTSDTPGPSDAGEGAGAAPAGQAETVVYGTFDPGSGHADWSDDACRILGIPADRLPRSEEACLALLHPDDRTVVAARVEEDLAAGRTSELDFRIVVGGGEIRTFRAHVSAQRHSNSGEVARVFWTLRDITDHRRVEGVLHHAGDVLALVVERCHEIITIRDAETGRLIYCSPSFTSITGIPRDGMPMAFEESFRLIHPADRELLRAGYEEVRSGRRVDVEWRLMRPDGQVRWMASRLVPLRDGDEVTRTAAIAEDVTDRRAVQVAERRRHDELSRAAGRSAMWELATALAHEIYQPLFSIRTYASACRRRVMEGTAGMDEIQEACDRIAAEADRSAEVIGRLRDLVRGRPPTTRPDDLNALVAEILRLAGPETLPPDMSVDLARDPVGPVVRADRVQIQQVLLNLIRNAVEAMADVAGPRRLWITVGSRGDEAWVSVEDTGPGIEADAAGRIFEPFFTTKPDGTGMGLAICRTIIDAHGGRLWAFPREGGGAGFTFALPLGERPGVDCA